MDTKSEVIDTLSYLEDPLLKARYEEETERVREQQLALDRTQARRKRLWEAVVERGLL